jgi:AcrR family transcriptional regulator
MKRSGAILLSQSRRGPTAAAGTRPTASATVSEPTRKHRSLTTRRSITPTRERILDEVERLIATRGVYGFKLHDVADPLKVKVPAIYKHFKSRDEVFVEVARRLITQLGEQFQLQPSLSPEKAMRAALDQLVEFKVSNPAYVRIALVDWATPDGGMEYLKMAAGGSFQDNFVEGPLQPMHARLRHLLQAGVDARHFRKVDPSDFYRLVKSVLLARLAYPDDSLLLRRPSRWEMRATQRWLWDIAIRYLSAHFETSG